MSTYLPVAFDNGARGAVFVGIDYGSADPMLALSRQMDYVVIGAGVVGVILLAVGLVFSIRVEQAHRETEDIFRTTQDGLFLLDHRLRMGSQTSQALSKVLGFDVCPGANFLELLGPSVSGNARRVFGPDFMISVPVVVAGNAKAIHNVKAYILPLRWHKQEAALVASLQ